MDGFVLIDKDIGLTSREVSSRVGRFFKTKKAGHVGTLDPFASGLLLVMINKANKSAICFDDLSKKYVATIKLGEYRDSLDITGQKIKEKEIPYLNIDQINEALSSFLGVSQQSIPLTSAKHVNGVRLYEYAHKGLEIDLPTHEIEVHDIKLIDYHDDEITFEAHVSKGTYIRVLGADIAEKLGTVGYLKQLRRTEVPPFNVLEAIKLDDLKEDSLIPTGEILSRFIKTRIVSDNEANDIKNGKVTIYEKEVADTDKLLIVNENKNPIALYTNVNNQYIFRRGLF